MEKPRLLFETEDYKLCLHESFNPVSAHFQSFGLELSSIPPMDVTLRTLLIAGT